ncbi:MAG: thiamine phosphate synthase, partial [Rhodospirillales bacterium]
MTVSSCRLYLITPPALPDLERFSQNLLRALDAGDVAVVQLRLKDAADEEILKAASKLCPLVQSRGAAF